jgi:hypothetical protein
VVAAAFLLSGAAPAPPTPDVDAGIRLVEDGDLEAAVETLAAVLPDLAANPERRSDLVRGHLYLGMAHLGLEHEERARVHFQRAWALSGGAPLDPKMFPPRVIALYEEAREAATPPPTAAPPPRPTPRRRAPVLPSLLTFGLGAAAGAGTAALGGGGDAAAPPPAAPLPPERTLRIFNCDDRCRVWLNGQLVAEVGLRQDSGRLDVTRRLGDLNAVVFEVFNEHGGAAYGFEVRVGEAIVFQEQCGVAARLGCEDDRSFPAGLVRRYEYVLPGK